MVKHIQAAITKRSAQVDLALMQSVFGTNELGKKLSGVVLDLDHVGIRSTITTLAKLYRIAEKYNLKESFLAELREIDSIVTTGRYGELTERYLALVIADKEFSGIDQALPEHKVLGDSNPDWTFRTKRGSEFYLEVSAVTIQKVIDDLQAFGGRLPTAQIIRSHSAAIYFEAIFPDNPRKYDPAIIGKLIITTARTKPLPASLTHDGVRVLVDLLSTRRQLPQLISDELNSVNLLKSTRLMGNDLTYTLAAGVSLKSVDNKIDEKKRSNKLDKIGNVWLCIFLDMDIEEFCKDEATLDRLRLRVSRSKWLNSLIVANRYPGKMDTWGLSYIKIDSTTTL